MDRWEFVVPASVWVINLVVPAAILEPGLGRRRVAGAIRPAAVVGRDDELTHGRELAVDTAAGRGRLLIQGEPGIGKTMLLPTILDTAADVIPDAVAGAADEFDQRLPFATLLSCLFSRSSPANPRLDQLD